MISGTVDVTRQERVPCRWHVLQILRAMNSGHPFIRIPGPSCLAHLEGVPLAVHFFAFLQRNGYIGASADDGLKAHYYTLTPDGAALYKEGERWWRSLRWSQKLRVIIWG